MLRLGSSLRAVPAAETFTLGARLMPVLGISRVTNVTQMDRLGLPVYISVRPRGLALCVNAGKGVLAMEARVGALMEAVEFAAAEVERSAWRRRRTRFCKIEQEWAGEVSLFDLAPRMGSEASPLKLIDVVQCEDVAGGRSLPLPAELVFVPFDQSGDEVLFGWSTNGLASGNTVEEATLHGLLEVLERDSIAMNTPCDASCWLDPDDLPEPFCIFARSWRRIGVELSVRFVPNVFGLPCFTAVVYEGGDAVVDMAEGHGLHLDPEIALSRAVCEAAQSRLSHIHGGRDDITRFYAKVQDPSRPRVDAQETLEYQKAFERRQSISWANVPAIPLGGACIADVVGRLIEQLRGLGFKKILRHRFAVDLGGLHVVKIIVPGCQELDTPWRRLGARLYEKVASQV